MENKNEDLDNLVTDLKDYLDTRSKLGKLKAIDKGSRIAAESASAFIIAIIGFLGLFFLSIAGALAISEVLENNYLGFFIVSVFYILVTLLFYINRDSWIQKPIVNRLIQNFFKDNGDEDL